MLNAKCRSVNSVVSRINLFLFFKGGISVEATAEIQNRRAMVSQPLLKMQKISQVDRDLELYDSHSFIYLWVSYISAYLIIERIAVENAE